MKGCPTCDQAPSMPHCGLNQDSWQDLTGLPDGADASSCKSVGDLDDNWCVQNCGGTPPNCPASLCKCKAPAKAGATPAPKAKTVSEAPSPIKAVGKAPSSPASSPSPTATEEAPPTAGDAQSKGGESAAAATNATAQADQQQQGQAQQQQDQQQEQEEEEVEGVGLVHGWTAQDTQQEAQIKEDREQEERCRVGPDGFCHPAGEQPQEGQQQAAPPQAKHEQGFEPGDPAMQMYFSAVQHTS